MTFHEIFSDGEVGGAMATLGIIAVAYMTPYICYGVRKWLRSLKATKA
jgi:hypothetical protein